MGAFRARALAAHPEVEQVFVGSHEPGAGPGARRSDRRAGRNASRRFLASRSRRAGDFDGHRGASRAHRGRRGSEGCRCSARSRSRSTSPTPRRRSSWSGMPGVELQIAFMRRFDAGFRQARELVSTGSVGTLYSLRMCAHDHEPADERYIATSGGIFCDLHVHDFDMARWLTAREVKEVFAIGTVRAWEAYGRQDDVDTARDGSDDGRRAAGRGHRGAARPDRLRLPYRDSRFAAIRSLWASMTGPRSTRSNRTLHRRPLDPYRGFLDRFQQAFIEETAAFVDLVQGRAPNACPPEVALSALRVAVACETLVAGATCR